MERSLEKMRQKRIRVQGDTRTNCQVERESVCVCVSSVWEDENEMFLRPRRGKESFYVDSGETSLVGTHHCNAPVSRERQLKFLSTYSQRESREASEI